MTDEVRRGPRGEGLEGFGALPEFWTAEEKAAAMALPGAMREELRRMHIQHRLSLWYWAPPGVQR